MRLFAGSDIAKGDADVKLAEMERRYRSGKHEVEKTEQEAWEEHQIRKSSMGTSVREGRRSKQDKEYDFVFENEIEFISEKVNSAQEIFWACCLPFFLCIVP